MAAERGMSILYRERVKTMGFVAQSGGGIS